MPQMLRTFVAVMIEPPGSIRPILRELAAMGSAVRAVALENLHVTLKFLGETDPRRVAEISEAVRTAVANESPFEVQLVGLGAYPRIERPNVIWAGLRDAEPLMRMASAVEATLADLGFPPERRAFQPHVTLARVKRKPPDSLGALLQSHAATEFGRVSVQEVCYCQSEPTNDGVRYTALSRVALGESG